MITKPSNEGYFEKRRKDWDVLKRLGYRWSNEAQCWYPVAAIDCKAPTMSEDQARALARMVQKMEDE
ncbi:hypothetical protein [Bartonella sp. CL63NXGY]|uniref:hypothetical protein n=1 Tax=Bartonella sp. CL63NXGY TaxID=3243538 RepID=UPI0035CE8EAE